MSLQTNNDFLVYKFPIKFNKEYLIKHEIETTQYRNCPLCNGKTIVHMQCTNDDIPIEYKAVKYDIPCPECDGEGLIEIKVDKHIAHYKCVLKSIDIFKDYINFYFEVYIGNKIETWQIDVEKPEDILNHIKEIGDNNELLQ